MKQEFVWNKQQVGLDSELEHNLEYINIFIWKRYEQSFTYSNFLSKSV
jgi:hypothetical protein